MTDTPEIKPPFTIDELREWYRTSVEGVGRSVGSLVQKIGLNDELNEHGTGDLLIMMTAINNAYRKMHTKLTGKEPIDIRYFQDVVRPYLK